VALLFLDMNLALIFVAVSLLALRFVAVSLVALNLWLSHLWLLYPLQKGGTYVLLVKTAMDPQNHLLELQCKPLHSLD
jgi:hypothetical protein